MSILLEVIEVTRTFGGLRALDRCSFTVPEGSVVGMIGPNGSGKTTILNCISGVLKADDGKILLSGCSIETWPAHRIARAGVGRTFQTTRLFSKLTVRQNLEAAAYCAGQSSNQAGFEFLKLFGLETFNDRLAGELSFGQQKLLELAVIMAGEPRIALLDEPAAGLNPAFVEILKAHIKRFQSAGRTFIIVEHEMPFIFSLCDTVVVLDQGRNIAQDSPDAIQQDDRVLAAYLGGINDA